MGFTDACFRDTEDDMIRALLSSGHRFLDGITIEKLDEKHSVRLNVANDGMVTGPVPPLANNRTRSAEAGSGNRSS